jgi:hypothetical protein
MRAQFFVGRTPTVLSKRNSAAMCDSRALARFDGLLDVTDEGAVVFGRTFRSSPGCSVLSAALFSFEAVKLLARGQRRNYRRCRATRFASRSVGSADSSTAWNVEVTSGFTAT